MRSFGRRVKQRRRRILSVLSAAERKALIDMLVRVIEANEAYVRPGAGRRKRSRHPPAGITVKPRAQ